MNSNNDLYTLYCRRTLYVLKTPWIFIVTPDFKDGKIQTEQARCLI